MSERKATISLRDAAMLLERPIKTRWCCICGAPNLDPHHEPPKGRVGPHDVTYSVCRDCHELLRHNGGTVELLPGHMAVADERACAKVNPRRVFHMRPEVKPGVPFEVW